MNNHTTPDPEQIKKIIPAKFYMISGSEDRQTSADVFNVGKFNLPNPAGKAGGACTSTLLSVLNQLQGAPITWIELLRQMRGVLRTKGFEQVPQLSTSRLIDVNEPFEIVPLKTKQVGGAKRALLIGINYVGQQGQLSGCHNDVRNIKDYLIRKEGFLEKDMLILMDDGRHKEPTRRNIEEAFQRLTQYSRADDVIFMHYSGHGGRVVDTSGDEDDGYDETLIPVDFKRAGQIVDDDIYKILVKAMPADVNVTVLMDCCHSGTALDLPYSVNATQSKMHANDSFNFAGLMGDDVGFACCLCLGYLLAQALMEG